MVIALFQQYLSSKLSYFANFTVKWENCGKFFTAPLQLYCIMLVVCFFWFVFFFWRIVGLGRASSMLKVLDKRFIAYSVLIYVESIGNKVPLHLLCWKFWTQMFIASYMLKVLDTKVHCIFYVESIGHKVSLHSLCWKYWTQKFIASSMLKVLNTKVHSIL